MATHIKLSNGLMMPSVGLGTSMNFDKDSYVRAIMDAGYRHIDTAFRYRNEAVIGEAL